MPNHKKIYILPIKETILAAWEQVQISKKMIWLYIIILMTIISSMTILSTLILPFNNGIMIGNSIYWLSQLVGFLLQFGIIYLAIQIIFKHPISLNVLFHAFQISIALRIFLLYALRLLIYLPFIFFITVSLYICQTETGIAFLSASLLFLMASCGLIYISLRTILSVALILDKNISPWQSILKSFAATRENFWRIMGIFVVEMLFIVLGTIPLGLGLIWVLPFVLLCYAIMYQKLSNNISNAMD
jgi:uncharacterized membrane protein